MIAIYWTVAILLPIVLLFVFTKSVTGQFARMERTEISLLSEFGFPNDASDPFKLSKSLSRKTTIYFSLFAASALLLWLLPLIGKIVFYLSSAFLLFLCFGQYFGLSAAKRAYRSINKAIRPNYAPVVRIYRTLFAYPVILLVVFYTFFNLMFLK